MRKTVSETYSIVCTKPTMYQTIKKTADICSAFVVYKFCIKKLNDLPLTARRSLYIPTVFKLDFPGNEELRLKLSGFKLKDNSPKYHTDSK